MTRHLLSVSSRALPGREAEYDRWYDEVHVGEVLALPGFVACERFERLAADGQDVGEFVALYEVETDDPTALLRSLLAAVPMMRLTDAIDPAGVSFVLLRPRGGGRKVATTR